MTLKDDFIQQYFLTRDNTFQAASAFHAMVQHSLMITLAHLSVLVSEYVIIRCALKFFHQPTLHSSAFFSIILLFFVVFNAQFYIAILKEQKTVDRAVRGKEKYAAEYSNHELIDNIMEGSSKPSIIRMSYLEVEMTRCRLDSLFWTSQTLIPFIHLLFIQIKG